MSDSAGVPWAGRRFEPNPAADDDGSADPRLIAALASFRSGELSAPEVVLALHAARVLIPLVTERGDEGVGTHGQLVDKTQELSIVTVRGPDGRTVLPVFSSVQAMRIWDATARPIPVAAARAALAAAAESTPLVVLDPGSETEFAVRRPALKSLATGERWLPCFEDQEVLAAFVASAQGELVRAVQLAPGDPTARLVAPELIVQLAVDGDPGEVVHRLSERWASDPLIADRVDSIAVRIERL